MKYFVTIISCAFVLIGSISAQSDQMDNGYDHLFDSLEIYKSNTESLDDYFRVLRTINDLISKNHPEKLKKILPYLESIENHPLAKASDLRRIFSIIAYDFNHFAKEQQLAYNCYIKSHEYGKTIDDIRDFWYVENVLGGLNNQRGDHEKALYFYKFTQKGLKSLINRNDVDEPDKNLYKSQLIRLLNNIGYLYFWNKDYELALSTFAEARNEALLSSNHKALLFNSRFQAETYITINQLDSARVYIESLESFINEISDPNRRNAEEVLLHKLKGQYYMKSGDCEHAIEYYTMSANTDKSPDRFSAKNLNQLAEAMLHCNQFDEARRTLETGFHYLKTSFNEIYASTRPMYEENTLAELLLNFGKYYVRINEESNASIYLDSALHCYKLALQNNELRRNQYLLENSKILSLEENRDLVERLIKIQYQSECKNLEEILQLFIKAKNVLLSDFDKEREEIDKLPEEIKEILHQHYKEIGNLTLQYQNAENTDEIEQINAKIIELRNEIKKHISFKNGNQGMPILSSKEKFIDYLWTNDGLYAIDNFTGNFRFTKLESHLTLQHKIDSCLTMMRTKDSSKEFYNLLNELYSDLLRPFEPLPKSFNIHPDGVLFLLPFGALIKNRDKKTYLIEEHILNVAYRHQVHQKAEKRIKGILLTIAPTYKEAALVAIPERGSLYHLPFAQKEIEVINAFWPGAKESHTQLSRESFLELMSQSDYLHFAGHAVNDGQSAWLYLGDQESDRIGYAELSRAGSQLNSVVLSACESGLGTLTIGEGLNSLAKSFLNAGASNVVYSLWNVNDQTTAALMESYYQEFSKSHSAVRSLRNAQLAYLENHAGELAHPYYWAAFVASESGFISEGKILTRSILLFSIIALLLIILFFQLKKLKR
jgi:CHAT domain-containing protein